MQLLQSGKVRLVAEDGRSYEVNSGMAACFSQCVVQVSPPADIAVKSESVSVPSSAMSGAAKSEGHVHFLGHITKKVVVVPEYELGVKQQKIGAVIRSNSLGNEEDMEIVDSVVPVASHGTSSGRGEV